ncbi:MAG: hypothetical protein NTAFB01_35640 [Nitrospira sp.]
MRASCGWEPGGTLRKRWCGGDSEAKHVAASAVNCMIASRDPNRASTFLCEVMTCETKDGGAYDGKELLEIK